jgi:hypothetical protein
METRYNLLETALAKYITQNSTAKYIPFEDIETLTDGKDKILPNLKYIEKNVIKNSLYNGMKLKILQSNLKMTLCLLWILFIDVLLSVLKCKMGLLQYVYSRK